MSNKLCKYFKICTCRCSGEADEVGEIDELCDIGRLYAKLEKIKDIVVANYTCKCALEELMNVFIEGAEDDKTM